MTNYLRKGKREWEVKLHDIGEWIPTPYFVSAPGSYVWQEIKTRNPNEELIVVNQEVK